MFDQIDNFTQQDSKGLFTFYKEQAQLEQQMKKKKKQRKLIKAKLAQERKRKRQFQQAQKILRQRKQFQLSDRSQQIKLIKERPRLYQPKNRRDKFNKHQIGNSVVIVDFKDSNTCQNRAEIMTKSNDQRSNLKRIEELINPHNNIKYFLQNKEPPGIFGRMSLQKTIIKNEQQKQEKLNQKQIYQKNFIKQNYFNKNNSIQDWKKCLPTFSYDKLPQLTRNKPSHSQIVLPKRYKSRKIEAALKSNNSQLIRQIRQSIREQSILCRTKEDVSYLQINCKHTKQIATQEKQYQNRLNSRLDAKTRRIMDILRISSHNKHKYH